MTQSLVRWEVERSDIRVITNISICNKEKIQSLGRNRKVSPHTLGENATNRKCPWEDQILDLVDKDYYKYIQRAIGNHI